jgi:hypothetical protein
MTTNSTTSSNLFLMRYQVCLLLQAQAYYHSGWYLMSCSAVSLLALKLLTVSLNLALLLLPTLYRSCTCTAN